MKEKLSINEYEEIKQLVDCALDAPNSLNGNAFNILSELISYVESASGRVRDKEHWIDCVKNRLYVLGWYGVEK